MGILLVIDLNILHFMLGEIKLPPPATAVETVKNVKRCMAV